MSGYYLVHGRAQGDAVTGIVGGIAGAVLIGLAGVTSRRTRRRDGVLRR